MLEVSILRVHALRFALLKGNRGKRKMDGMDFFNLLMFWGFQYIPKTREKIISDR